MGLQRVRYDWATKHSTTHIFIKSEILSQIQQNSSQQIFIELLLCAMYYSKAMILFWSYIFPFLCVLPLFSFSSLLVIFWTYLQSSILSSSLITLFWPICMYLFCLSIKILIAQPTEEIMDLNHTHTMCQASRSNTKDYMHAQFLSQVRLFETPWM